MLNMVPRLALVDLPAHALKRCVLAETQFLNQLVHWRRDVVHQDEICTQLYFDARGLGFHKPPKYIQVDKILRARRSR